MPLNFCLTSPGLCIAAVNKQLPERRARSGPQVAADSKEAVGGLGLNHTASGRTTTAGIGMGGIEQLVEAHVQALIGLIKRTTSLDANVEQVLEGGSGILTWLKRVEQPVAAAAPAVSGADHGEAIHAARGDVGQPALLEEGVKAG